MRSSTPPLYYHRPDGVPASYYTARDMTLRLPPRASVSSFVPPAPAPAPAPLHDAAAELSLLAEEQSLRGELSDLRALRQRLLEEQRGLSAGWALLLEREERFFTEPLPDLRADTAARAQRCAALADQLRRADAAADQLRREHSVHDATVAERDAIESQRRRVAEALLALERRRVGCANRAELYFDTESRRAAESARVCRAVDAELRDLANRPPLAEVIGTAGNGERSRSTSRGVTFAQKSIVLDLGGPGEDSTGVSQCSEDEEGIAGSSAAYSLSCLKRTRTEIPTA